MAEKPKIHKPKKESCKKDGALGLSAAITRSFKKDLAHLEKQNKSDAALIESLLRYIEALEGKAKMQEETIRNLLEAAKQKT